MGYKHKVLDGWKRVLPILGSMGCASAMVVLLYNTYNTNRATLYIVAGISIVLIISRELYIWVHSNYKGKTNNQTIHS
jgi:hypothetical protein